MDRIKKRFKNKRSLMIFIIILAIIILVLLIYLFGQLLEYLSIVEKQRIKATVFVGDNPGIDLNTTALTFGMVQRGGGSATRKLILDNSEDKNVKIKIYIEGNISQLMQVSDNNFILGPGEIKEVKFTVIPGDLDGGWYLGEVIVYTQKATIK
ncbi:hypothetical protein GOV14_04395 [Candidatus Pacearchaeota archaeon]|nr:hypothetical protein [Candidatus Pacearchaeota archaeon]